MKEKPILMCHSMALATREDRKTQTRRIVKSQPIKLDEPWPTPESHVTFMDVHAAPDYYAKCGYCPYQLGTRVWIRENYYQFGHWMKNDTTKTGRLKWKFVADNNSYGVVFDAPTDFRRSRDKEHPEKHQWYRRLGRFMPKKYARTWCEVTEVRVEKVTDISEEDAKSEGIETELWKPTRETGWRNYNVPRGFDREACMLKTARGSFQSLWESIHGPDSWKPVWVWVIEFKRVRT